MNDRMVRMRFIVSAAIMLLAMVGLGTRLAFLHLGPNDKIRMHATDLRRFEKKLSAGRGEIYDCRGRNNILALNLGVKDVCADPTVILESNSLAEVSSFLSEKLDLPVDQVAIRINKPGKRFAYVRRFVSEENADAVRAGHMSG
ncbi:MAG: hypothetical protein JXN60_03280, partial [Lentisphaerae bacterium]|nr:hypothetical protein [Lentisphaerota bacterium]